MKSRGVMESAQSAYLLEYGRRRIQVCADTFRNLAQIFGEEESGEGKEGGGTRPACFIRKRMAEERRIFAGNLQGLADMMNGVADESVRFISLGARRQKQIAKGLLGEGILAGDLYLVQRGNGHMELSVTLSSRTKSARTAEEAADYLSVLMDMRLVSAKRNSFFIGEDPLCYFFEEEPGYIYMTGSARAVKETETVSGDNFAFFEAEDGNLSVVLSDGMGSGEEAFRDSGAVADMTEAMLEAGLEPEMAVRLLNGAVTGNGREDKLPTLDLCSVDLYEGRCQFLKAGAAASFIKHGSTVEKVAAATLPLGAFERMRPERIRREIYDGDYIILLSDGVTEGWPTEDGEERICELLAGLDILSPSEMAGQIMRYAIEHSEGRIRDDMTVLVAGIWERQRQ